MIGIESLHQQLHLSRLHIHVETFQQLMEFFWAEFPITVDIGSVKFAPNLGLSEAFGIARPLPHELPAIEESPLEFAEVHRATSVRIKVPFEK